MANRYTITASSDTTYFEHPSVVTSEIAAVVEARRLMDSIVSPGSSGKCSICRNDEHRAMIAWRSQGSSQNGARWYRVCV